MLIAGCIAPVSSKVTAGNRFNGTVEPFGDSITAGIGTVDPWSNSYRGLLSSNFSTLLSDGAFTKNALLFSAVSGIKSDYMLANIGTWYTAHPATLGILMIGHNDPIVAPTIAPGVTAANIANSIAACQAINPDVLFLVCAPVNATTPWDVYNSDYNAIEAALPALLAPLGPNVTLMTPRPTFLASDYLDGEHFNYAGCQKFENFIALYLTALGFGPAQ